MVWARQARVAVKRGKIKTMRDGVLKNLLIQVERTEAQIRADVMEEEDLFLLLDGLARLSVGATSSGSKT